MQYERIKKSLGRFIAGSVVMRKTLYFLLDLLLLRSWHVRKKLRKIGKKLPEYATILDAGSGFGQYTWRMARLNRKWQIKAVDINSEEIAECLRFFCRTRLAGRVEFATIDLTKLNETALYDLILTVDVMEHIDDDTIVFRNFCNALKNGGYLLISTPSDKGGSDVHGEDEKSFIDEHVRDGYGIEEITGKLMNAGFRHVEARYSYGRPGSISWRFSMKYPVMMLSASYLFFIFLPFYYLIFFPFSLVLNLLDTHMDHKSGSGLIILAEK